MLSWLGGGEILAICCVGFVFFGGKQLPKLARGVGEAITEFRKAGKAITAELDEAADIVKDI